MNFADSLLHFLKGTMTVPEPYHWFHLFSLALIVALTVFLCLRFRDCSDRVFRRILLIGWIVIILLEVYKQVAYVGFQGEPGSYKWEYQWYAFPFQFCSTPHYILPFIIFCKPGRVRNACMAFMTTFALFAGVAVCVYPGDVFVSQTGINIQTMVHHGLQVVFGIFIAVYNRHRFNIKWYLSSLPVFGAMVAAAMLLDGLVPLWIDGDQVFNMFYISWRFPSTLPILTLLYQDPVSPNVPYPVFLLIYLVGFALAALVMFGIVFGFIKLAQALAAKKEAKKAASEA